jgi:hypothetical protein
VDIDWNDILGTTLQGTAQSIATGDWSHLGSAAIDATGDIAGDLIGG